MVHLLVLGLLALLFGGVIGSRRIRNLFLFYRFSRCGDSKPAVFTDAADGLGDLFANDCLTLSFSLAGAAA